MANKVIGYLTENPKCETVELILHQPKELSAEVLEKVRNELKKVKGAEI